MVVQGSFNISMKKIIEACCHIASWTWYARYGLKGTFIEE